MNLTFHLKNDWPNSNNDPGHREYNDEELVVHVRGKKTMNMWPLSHAQACKAMEMIVVYLEQQPHIPMSTTVLLNGLSVRKRVQTLIRYVHVYL